jgi:CoA-transferase family III
MIPPSLLDAIADECAAVTKLSRWAGRSVALEPEQLLQRDIALSPAGICSPNGHCRLVETADGWIAVNLARPDDRDSVAAWLERVGTSSSWDVITERARNLTTNHLLDRAELLGLPVASVGETKCAPSLDLARCTLQSHSAKVVDLSALWAGPLCGAILAEAGLAVTKLEDPARPDPTRESTPEHDRRLNGRKQRISIGLTDSVILDLIVQARVLITSARPHALTRLGLTRQNVFDRNQNLIWIAITAHGFSGAGAMRVGFGDDTAAAGGLIGWTDESPNFLGDALADPLTGLRAAHLALDAVATGQSGLIDVPLASTAWDFARQAGLL